MKILILLVGSLLFVTLETVPQFILCLNDSTNTLSQQTTNFPETIVISTTTNAPKLDEPYVGWVDLMNNELYLAMNQDKTSGIVTIVLVAFALNIIIFGIMLYFSKKIADWRRRSYYTKVSAVSKSFHNKEILHATTYGRKS